MSPQDVLSEYAAATELMRRMLAAAQAGDWKELIVLEQRYAAHIETLQRGEDNVALAPAALLSKQAYIASMLSDERQVRALTKQWMAKLTSMIDSSGTQRRLGDAYGSV